MKGRMSASGSVHWIRVPNEEASIPTVSTDKVLITSVEGYKQERRAMSHDILNALAQTEVLKSDERIMMKI